MLQEEFRAQRLVGKAHIHHRSGVPFSRCQVDQATLTKDVNLATISQFVSVHKRAYAGFSNCHFFERGDIELHIEMPRVPNQGSVFHYLKMVCVDHVQVTSDGDENVTNRGGFHHRHYPEAIHNRFQRHQRVNLGYDHIRAHTTGTHRQPASAPAITSDNKILASQ